MKKSRIIIPALAMIAFSVAASITGTVAWFTANRTTNIGTGTYAVVKTTANLTKTVEGVVGTSVNTSDDSIIDVDGKLTDGSFDHVGSNNYIIAPDPTGAKVGSKVALADALDTDNFDENDLIRGQTTDSTPINIYTAVIWKVTFSMDFGAAASNDIGLFLDLSQSSFTATGESGSNADDKDTSLGFRMAFMPVGDNAANGNARIFADLQAFAKCHYIGNEPAANAPLASNEEDYVTPALIDSAATGTLDTSYDEDTEADLMPNYFGKFPFAANTVVDLEFAVVCWFEGTDENIVNSTEDFTTYFRNVSATLVFSAIDLE